MSVFLRHTLLRQPRIFNRIDRVGLYRPALIAARGVASTVTNKPGSQGLGHAATNIAEEASNTVKDVAKTIAGASEDIEAKTTFTGITSAIAAQVPQPVMVLGLAGTLPYLGTSLTSMYLAREAGIAVSGGIAGVDPGVAVAVMNSCLDIQVAYGAVLLSFLGAMHWGFEFAAYGGEKGYRRLLLGAAPILIAWPTLSMAPMLGLMTQWVGFTGLWYADMKATSNGWVPQWYSQYRFYLSIVVGTCIIGTAAITSFLGPVAGHSYTTKVLEHIREEQLTKHTESEGLIDGDIEAVSTGEMGDSYVKIRKRTTKEEEEGAAAEDTDSDSDSNASGEKAPKGDENDDGKDD